MSDNGCDKDNKMASRMEAIAMHVVVLRAPDKMAVITIASTVYGSFCVPVGILVTLDSDFTLQTATFRTESNTQDFKYNSISFYCNLGLLV